jgi:CDP-glucose 4,6-dehydratase
VVVRQGAVARVVTMAPISRFHPTPEFWRGKRVFVTGHTGFKGSWLTLWLAELGARVRGYALAPDTEPSLCRALAIDGVCDSVIADVRDPARLAAAIADFRPDVAIHLAAQSLVRPSYRDPLGTFATNVQGTANFLEGCRAVETLRAVVIVTTDKCYLNREQLAPYDEDEPLGGRDPYSASKACAELVTQAYRLSFFNRRDAAQIASARGGNVFGGGDWCRDRLVPDAVRAFCAGETVAIRNPGAVRPWQHVIPLLTGYLLLARALCEEGPDFAVAFNFGPSSGRAISVRALIEQMIAAWGDGARWESRHDPTAPHEAELLMLDAGRARAMLEWAPPEDLTASIRATVEWYKAFYAGAGAQEMRRLSLAQIAALSQAPGLVAA